MPKKRYKQTKKHREALSIAKNEKRLIYSFIYLTDSLFYLCGNR